MIMQHIIFLNEDKVVTN